MTVAAAAQGTAISVAMDMTEGIIARFRTMAIFRPSVLTGHVLGSMIQTALSLAVVIGVALLIGFRPTAGPVEWIAAIGVLAMITFALTWLSVYQPFTPVIETLRGLLLGSSIGNSAIIAIAWCAAIALASYLWARAAFNRDPAR